MNIKFDGKYKSLNAFYWEDVPDFVVLTGANGAGKSQLLNLLYLAISNNHKDVRVIHPQRTAFEGAEFDNHDVRYIEGEWSLRNVKEVDFISLQTKHRKYYDLFKMRDLRHEIDNYAEQQKYYSAFHELLVNGGYKSASEVDFSSFVKLFSFDRFESRVDAGTYLSEIFFNYRLDEIDLSLKGLDEDSIILAIGQKPWLVVREIIKEANLPFIINDPSGIGFRDSFTLVFTDVYTGAEVELNELSSGEKVLISLAFMLFDSQEKGVFPKLLLLDEPDAHLHPAMTKHFINVVKNVLVDNFKVKVIMTTHSPTTVMLSPVESVFEMHKTEPRIRKSISKSDTVSLLTAGLLYIDHNTKYFLVEDKDDADFYSYINSVLLAGGLIRGDVPLVFMPASISTKSGGKAVVEDWVKKLADSGLSEIVKGLIDADSGNIIFPGMFKLERYSIENYLIDPILIYIALLDKEKEFLIDGIELKLGDEYKVHLIGSVKLQCIADAVIAKLSEALPLYFNDLNDDDFKLMSVVFNDGAELLYPQWIFRRRGKTLLNELVNSVFKSTIVNHSTLFKALRKVNFLPIEFVELFSKMKL